MHEGMRIQTAADVRAFLEQRRQERPHAAELFPFLDKRALHFSVSRGEKFNVREYDQTNGRGVARAAIEQMRALLAQKTQELGDAQAAIAAITSVRWVTLTPPIRRYYAPGAAVIQEICDDLPPPPWEK